MGFSNKVVYHKVNISCGFLIVKTLEGTLIFKVQAHCADEWAQKS